MNNKISVAPLYEDYLAHYQIKGAKWGVMHGPPYPLSRGKGGRLPKVKKVTSAAKERAAEKKSQKAETKKENLRKYIVEHPNKLYKYKDMFSKKELESLIDDINFDQKLRDVNRNAFKKTVETASDFAKLASSVKTVTTSAVDIYKASQNIKSILKSKGIFSDDTTANDSKNNKKNSEKPKDKSASSSKEAPKQNSDQKANDSDLNPELKKLLGIS